MGRYAAYPTVVRPPRDDALDRAHRKRPDLSERARVRLEDELGDRLGRQLRPCPRAPTGVEREVGIDGSLYVVGQRYRPLAPALYPRRQHPPLPDAPERG